MSSQPQDTNLDIPSADFYERQASRNSDNSHTRDSNNEWSGDVFRAVFERSPVGICLLETRTGRFLQANRQYCELVGRTEQELKDLDIYAVTHPDDLAKARENGALLAKRVTASFEAEKRYVRPDGSIRWVHAAAVSLREAGVETPFSIGIVTDITERKQAEEALRESEARLRLAQEVAKIGTFERDLATGETNWSPEMEALYGLPPGAAPKSIPAFLELIHPDDRASMDKLIADSIATGEAQGEWRVNWPDGTVHWISGRWKVFHDTQGRPLRAVGMDFDITDRKLTEENLRRSEERERARAKELETILDTLPIPVMIAHDAECRRMTTNRAGREFLQVREGTNVAISAPPEERPPFRFLRDGLEIPAEQLPMQRAAATGQPVYQVATEVLLEDGTAKYELGNAAPLFDENGKVRGAVGAAVDITDHKRAEEALRQTEERFRVALSNSPIKVYNQDRDLRYTWVYNPPEGWTADDYLGKTDAEVFGAEDGGRMRALKQKVLDTGQSVRDEFALTMRGKRYYCDVTVEPFRDAAGKIVGVNSACVDLTHLHQITEELRQAKEKLTEEKLYLEQTFASEMGFEEIIGRSNGLKAVMELAARVATSDATVLLLGETGVGKELVARAIHRLSKRSGNSFIKMNCAAIPHGLLESELFGAEKGAYTGSVSRKIGRLELADKGTIFLDEIGEVSLALQPKLLRVLQDHELERLGGTQTINVDFRLIAATNRDLRECVKKNEFRSDLFYRLNVFPIYIPPLRERRDDIPPLVEHFVQKCALRMNKPIASIPKKTMSALAAWDWPGNVRELENFIERSVILTQGSVLGAPLSELQVKMFKEDDETLASAERQLILRALRESHGKISGERGAAARLGLKRTTLQSKLRHLGIDPRRPQA